MSSFWDWLWEKALGARARLSSVEPDAPRSLPPRPPPPLPTSNAARATSSEPEMTNIRVTAPSAVRPVLSIQPAIELMRTLPIDENPDLVLRVLRKTLRSTGVEVSDTIDEARKHEEALASGMASDRAAIVMLEEQIAVRKANITRLEAELSETKEVRARLEEAVQSETKIGPVLPPDEIARIQAEAKEAKEKKLAARAAAVSSPPVAPPVPSPSKKPPPKLPSFPPAIPKKEPIPKPTSTTPSTSTSTVTTPSKPPVKAPVARPIMSSIPDIDAIDDGFNDPTEKTNRETPVPGGDD